MRYASPDDGGDESSFLHETNETFGIERIVDAGDATGIIEDHRRLAASTGQDIAFHTLRILIPLTVFISCYYYCHCSSRRRRVEGGEGGHAGATNSGTTRERVEAREEDRSAMLAETLVFKGVVEADEENPAPTSGGGGGDCSAAVKGDIYVPKSAAAASRSTAPISTRLMEDPFSCEEHDDEDRPTCSICMMAYEPGETVCWSPNPECTHAFHWECMGQWLLKHDDCPQCRNNYLLKATVAAAAAANAVEGEDNVLLHPNETAASTFSSRSDGDLDIEAALPSPAAVRRPSRPVTVDERENVTARAPTNAAPAVAPTPVPVPRLRRPAAPPPGRLIATRTRTYRIPPGSGGGVAPPAWHASHALPPPGVPVTTTTRTY